MKLLILNASPRPNGHIARMLEVMEKEARRLGIETERIKTNRLNIQPCTGCMTCRTRLQCVLPPDDAQRVLQLLTESDALLIGSPCYWGNMPGTLKVMFDRMVYGLMGESPKGLPRPLHKGKKALIVSTCTTPWPFNRWFDQSHGTVKALREILKWSGFRIVKTIERGGTKTHPTLSEKELERCRKAVRKLNVGD